MKERRALKDERSSVVSLELGARVKNFEEFSEEPLCLSTQFVVTLRN